MTTTPQPTPETDAESINGAHHPQFVLSDFARKLERERDEARRNAEVERLSGVAVVAMCKRQESEIKALREAIKEAHRCIRNIVSNHECGSIVDAHGESVLTKLQPFLP